MKDISYWLPRLLAIVFIAFISLFALDVIGQSEWLLGLLIHLIPSFILTAVTIIAWNNERIGGAFFILTGMGFLIFTNFENFIIAIPAFAIGLLFLINKKLWCKRN